MGQTSNRLSLLHTIESHIIAFKMMASFLYTIHQIFESQKFSLLKHSEG